jgi:hypothetical protein
MPDDAWPAELFDLADLMTPMAVRVAATLHLADLGRRLLADDGAGARDWLDINGAVGRADLAAHSPAPARHPRRAPRARGRRRGPSRRSRPRRALRGRGGPRRQRAAPRRAPRSRCRRAADGHGPAHAGLHGRAGTHPRGAHGPRRGRRPDRNRCPQGSPPGTRRAQARALTGEAGPTSAAGRTRFPGRLPALRRQPRRRSRRAWSAAGRWERGRGGRRARR